MVPKLGKIFMTLPAQDGKITVVKWWYLMEKLKEKYVQGEF